MLSPRSETRKIGISEIERGLAAFRPTGAKYISPPYLCLLAETCCKAGRIEKGLDAINDVFAEVGGNRFPEMYLLKGELLFRQSAFNAAVAEECIRQGIEIAGQSSARLWGLRATTSLARLLRDTGRRDEARAMLAEIYNWFTEGFDTADLKDAKALLDELNA